MSYKGVYLREVQYCTEEKAGVWENISWLGRKGAKGAVKREERRQGTFTEVSSKIPGWGEIHLWGGLSNKER